jgi:amino acid adenylation domain-containing protein
MTLDPDLVARLSKSEKRELLLQLLTKRQQNQAHTAPLSQGQQALWVLHQLAPESWAYNVIFAARIRSQVDIPALERAFQALVDRHQLLRTTYLEHDGRPVQQIHAQYLLPITQIEATSWDESQLYTRLLSQARAPFNLKDGPVMRVYLFHRPGGECVLLLAVHHIAADFWSLGTLLQELGKLYTYETGSSEGSPLPPLNRHYTDFVRQQEQFLGGPEGERLWHYWQQELAGELPILNLPFAQPRPETQSYRGAAHWLDLEPDLVNALKMLAREEETTLYTVLLAALYVLLHRYTKENDILIGCPTAGRNRPDYAHVVGCFINPVVIRAHIDPRQPFTQFLAHVHHRLRAGLKHQAFPFPLLVQRLRPERDPSRQPLFQITFTLQKLPLLPELTPFMLGRAGAKLNLGGLELEPIVLPQQEGQVDLTIALCDIGDSLAINFSYNTDLFAPETISRLANHFHTLLDSIVLSSSKQLSRLPFLTTAERQYLLEEWNESASVGDNRCLHTWFAEQVAQSPDTVAVQHKGTHLTYRLLNHRANRLARWLCQLGPETVVGLCFEPSPEMVVAMMATLQAGGAFMPLDPQQPAERLIKQLINSGTPVLLTQEALLPKLAGFAGTILCLDKNRLPPAKSDINMNPGVEQKNVAYVVYTSGSTGEPKGVLIDHEAIVNTIAWRQEALPLLDGDRLLQTTPFAFDATIAFFLEALLNEATLVLPESGVSRDPTALAAAVQKENITVIQFPPSQLRLFLEAPEAEHCSSLRRIVCGAESLPHSLKERCLTLFNATLHNLYGPTEIAVDATAWNCKTSVTSSSTNVPIGRPVANKRVYLLNSFGEPVPAGVPGELFVGGTGLARGYLNQQYLTAERFIPDPFSNERGARMYRTGDLARLQSDGALEFLGRCDHQVRIRGFRVELGEIEQTLNRHPAVQTCVVLDREEEPDKKRLVAYVVPEDQEPSTSALRRFLHEQLPTYMIPAFFTFLTALPFTSNGKIDRKALPAPEPQRPQLETVFLAPRDEIERRIVRIWQAVLSIDQVGVNDNFFDLGGHSLLVVQVQKQLKKTFGREISMAELFKHTTIAQLANYFQTVPDAETSAHDVVVERTQSQATARRDSLRRRTRRR